MLENQVLLTDGHGFAVFRPPLIDDQLDISKIFLYFWKGRKTQIKKCLISGKTGLPPPPLILLIVSRRFLCCSSSLSMHRSSICGVCFVISCSSPLIYLVPWENCALWLGHFLSIFTYINKNEFVILISWVCSLFLRVSFSQIIFVKLMMQCNEHSKE